MASYSVSLLAIVWLSGIKVNDLVNELSIQPILNAYSKFFENIYYIPLAPAHQLRVILFSRGLHSRWINRHFHSFAMAETAFRKSKKSHKSYQV